MHMNEMTEVGQPQRKRQRVRSSSGWAGELRTQGGCAKLDIVQARGVSRPPSAKYLELGGGPDPPAPKRSC
eukprot:6084672-Prymnesium_polylepis.1